MALHRKEKSASKTGVKSSARVSYTRADLMYSAGGDSFYTRTGCESKVYLRERWSCVSVCVCGLGEEIYTFLSFLAYTLTHSHEHAADVCVASGNERYRPPMWPRKMMS